MATIKITKHRIISAFKAIENIPDGIEFDSYKVAHDLALNKKIINPVIDAMKLMDRPCSEFKEYQKHLDILRAKFDTEHEKMRSEAKLLSDQFQSAIDKEVERREKWAEELDKEVEVENIKLIKLADIKGNGAQVMRFISAVEPFIDFEIEKIE